MQTIINGLFTIGRVAARLAASSYVVYSLSFLMLLMLSLARYDPDLGWHLRSGKYIIEHGAPSSELFTYTATDFPWVHHEWLADGLHFLVYDTVGFYGLAILHATLWTFGFWCFARNYKQQWPVWLATLAVSPLVGVRALSWMVALLGVLRLLVIAQRRYIWLLPVLLALWANLHGSFLVGIVYLLYLAIRRRQLVFGLVAVLSLGATLLNPYGVGLYEEIVRTVFDTSLSHRISEWSSWMLLPIMIPYVGIWLAGLVQLYRYSGWLNTLARFDVVMALAMISSWRHAVLFALFALPLVLRTVNQLPKLQIPTHDRAFVAGIGFVLGLTGSGLVVMALGGYTYSALTGGRDDHYPQSIVRSLQQTPCQGNVFNDYDVGGYLIWHLPDQPVYIDGRMPSWQHESEHFFETYLAIFDDKQTRDEEFARHDISCALLPKNNRLANTLRQEGWSITLVDQPSRYILIEREFVQRSASD